MTRARPLHGFAAGFLGVTLLAGCSGAPVEPPPTPAQLAELPPTDAPAGNGLWLLSDEQATAEIDEAILEARTVAYSGEYTELTAADGVSDPVTGRSLRVAYRGWAGEFAATIDAGAQHLELVVVDGRSYLHGNAAYAEAQGMPALAQGFVCTTGADGILDEWAPLLEPHALLGSLLGASEAVAVEPPLADEAVLDVVLGQGGAPVGVLTVARTGAPLPQTFTAADPSGNGSFTFEAWGEPMPVEAPTKLSSSCEG